MLKLAHNAKPPKRLVVLGGSGFVGKSVLELAKSRGMRVLSLGSKDLDLCAENAAEKLSEILKPKDTVVFASAIGSGLRSGSDVFMRNILIARNVAEALRQLPLAQTIYLSSDAVYGFDTALINEATPPSPATLYGLMHRAREMILATEANVPLAVLRLPAIYGAGDTHNAYGPNRFVRQAMSEGKITLFGKGEEMRDHLYVEDAAELILQTTLSGATGLLNPASGNSISFRTIAEKIAALTQARIETAPRKQPITHLHFDVTARLQAFPQFVPTTMDEVLAAMCQRDTRRQSTV